MQYWSYAHPEVIQLENARENVGEYQLLFKYLRDRYANRLVLTFAQIEDLLGFPLPEVAARDLEWWSSDKVAARSPQSLAWTSASRTAAVNLGARIVVFERQIVEDAVKMK